MGTDVPSIFALARDITVTGGVLFILIASYLGKYWWAWQVEKALAEKDKIIAERDGTIVLLRAEVAEYKKREDDDNNQYRDVAWAALAAARESASVGKEIVSAVRTRRG